MDNTDRNASSGLDFAQIAWVVQDVETAKTLFQEMPGVSNFSGTSTTRLKEYNGTLHMPKAL